MGRSDSWGVGVYGKVGAEVGTVLLYSTGGTGTRYFVKSTGRYRYSVLKIKSTAVLVTVLFKKVPKKSTALYFVEF